VRLIVGLVDNRAYNGDRERNPFNFRYAAAYAGLFGGTNKINRDEGNNIDRSDHAGGYALYAYDLTPDLAENDQVNLSRQGTVRLNLKFGAALAHTITVVAYAEFENMIEIDRNRNIVFDFSN
jgi:hypothetical protein